MKYFYLFLVLLLIDVSFGCPLDCSQVKCIQGFNPFNCEEDTIYVNNAAMCGCCPGCVRLKGPGQTCQGDTEITFDVKNYYTTKTYFSTEITPVVESKNCAPGLKCIDTRCQDVDNKYTCIAEATPDNSQPYKWLPSCDIDGSYRPVQCKERGSDPRCFCYSKTGTRIFGIDWIENKDKMKCLCSRLVDDLKKNEENLDVTYHCSSNGNFEPLQCNRGICYCANVYTGQPISAIVAEPWWKTLPCYNTTEMGATYLKTCDSRSNALALIKKEMKYHGAEPIGLQAPPCDPDGSYYAKQCTTSECYCRTRDNLNSIGAFLTGRGTDAERKQKCYCARDMVIFADQHRPFNYMCDGGGDYLAMQEIYPNVFCVDKDGSLVSEIVKIEKKCTLPCATAEMCPP